MLTLEHIIDYAWVVASTSRRMDGELAAKLRNGDVDAVAEILKARCKELKNAQPTEVFPKEFRDSQVETLDELIEQLPNLAK